MEICSPKCYRRPQPKVWSKPAARHLTAASYPGFVPAAPVTDEEVAKVLLTKYQSLCPSTSPMELEREINRWRHRADIDDKPQTAISALNNEQHKAFLTSGTFCCYLLLCPSPLVSLREFSPKYKGPRQPSEARWEQSDLRPLLSSQPIAPPCLHIKILLIRSA